MITRQDVKNYLTSHGINASIRTDSKGIIISRYKYGIEFKKDEIEIFTRYMRDNGFTFARGLEINPKSEMELTGGVSWVFHRK